MCLCIVSLCSGCDRLCAGGSVLACVWVSNVTEDFGEEISKELSFRYAVISSG